MIDKKQISKLYTAAKLSDTEQGVLEYLLNNMDSASDLGVRAVASACFTSMTTVVRLSKKLGYQGYREMMYDLRNLQHASGELNQCASRSDVHFTCRDDDLKLFMNALHHRRIVGINGEGFSRIVAEYMMNKLIGAGFLAVIQDFLETDQFIETYRDRLDCMILVSKSGQTPAILETARACQASDVLLVAFTGNANSELAEAADAIFFIEDDHPLDLRNVQPNCFSGNCILAFEEILSMCLDNLDTLDGLDGLDEPAANDSAERG